MSCGRSRLLLKESLVYFVAPERLRGRIHEMLAQERTAEPAHEAPMPGHLIDVASTDERTVKPWFNGRVDLSAEVPALEAAGFPLVGGRLDYVSGRTVAAVVYARQQHVINVFSCPDAGADIPRSSTDARGYHLVRWRRDNTEYWVVSDIDASDLSQFVMSFEHAVTREADRD